VRRFLIVALIVVVGIVCVELAMRPFVRADLVGPSAERYDPYYGRVLKPGRSAPVTYNDLTYRVGINALGFRGPEVPDPAHGSILFFGDSWTFGVAVDNDGVFPELVRRALDDRFGAGTVPVLNTAMAGSGQGRWLRFLRRDAAGFEPRFVVMQFCRNDFDDNHIERLYELDESGAVREVAVAPQSRLRALQERIESVPMVPHSRIYAVVKQMVKHVFTDEGRRAEQAQRTSTSLRTESGPDDDLTYRITEACLEICRERGWPVVAISAPIPDGERRNRLVELLAQYGHELVSIPDGAGRPDLYFPAPHGRWNGDGHRFVAEVLLEQILSHPEFAGGDGVAAPR
jgi:hypothetical protein